MPKTPGTALVRRNPTNEPGQAVTAAVPRGGRAVAVRRPPGGKRRHGMTQPKIQQIEALRIQGFTFKEIAIRVGYSERTARRYGCGVKPKLQLPGEKPELTSMDPGSIRAALLAEYMERLYNDKGLRAVTFVWHPRPGDGGTAEYGQPPSVLFLNEAEHMLRRALDRLGPLSVRMLARDARSKRRFLLEVIGALYSDYIAWHQFHQAFDPDIETAPYWRPPSERPEQPEIEFDNPYGLPED